MQQQIDLFRTTKGYQRNHKTTLLKCSNCKSEFLANRKNAKYCSSSCRSQAWLDKNQRKIITLSVPADIDEAFLERIKEMLENYKSPNSNASEAKKMEAVQEAVIDNLNELTAFLNQHGIVDFKIPKVNQGVYYDEGLMIKKLPEGWKVKIS